MNKASTNIHFYKNENGPVIGVTVKPVIEKDGLYSVSYTHLTLPTICSV